MTIINIHSQKGNFYDIEKIEKFFEEKEKLDFFRQNGINGFCENYIGEYEIILSCIEKTLLGINKKDIQKVIIATSSLDDFSIRKPIFSKILCDLGLSHVIPLGLFLSRCNNYTAAFKLGQSILLGEDFSKVLVLNFDWMRYSSKTNQVMDSNLSILSDAVVSCILDRDDREGFKLIDVELEANQLLYKNNLGLVNEMKYLSNGLKKISKNILERNELTINDFGRLITGNYNKIVQKNYALILGFDLKKISYDQEQGHFFSGDQLIQLEKLEKEDKIECNEKIFLLGTGDYYWGVTILEKITT